MATCSTHGLALSRLCRICGELSDMDVQYKISSYEKMLEDVFHQQFSDIPDITPSFMCSQGGERHK